MKKTRKKIFGVFGLLAVAATTAFAVSLPAPETQAVSTVKDKLTVTVISQDVDATITEPANDSVFVGSDVDINYSYNDAHTITITVAYTDKDGVTTEHIFAEEIFIDDTKSGTGSFGLDEVVSRFASEGWEYGDYKITVTATGINGDTDSDTKMIHYYPVIAAAEDSGEGQVNVDLNYENSEGKINKFVINVYDEDGNLVEGLSPYTTTLPTTGVTLPFSDYGLDSGKYRIEVFAFDGDDQLYKQYTVFVDYTSPGGGVSPTDVPDTGGFFQSTNISQTDYLITGLIVFGLVAIASFVFIAKNNKKGQKSSRK